MEDKSIMEQVNMFYERGSLPSKLYVFDVKEFAKKVVGEMMPWESSITVYKGLQVVSKSWMPKDKACLLDTSGEVIAIFDL